MSELLVKGLKNRPDNYRATRADTNTQKKGIHPMLMTIAAILLILWLLGLLTSTTMGGFIHVLVVVAVVIVLVRFIQRRQAL